MAVVAYSTYWIAKFERFYYKMVMWVIFFVVVLKLISGYDLNVELIPFFIALYVYDNLRVVKDKNLIQDSSA